MLWKRLVNRVVRTTGSERLQLVSLNMPGWVDPYDADYRGVDGSVLRFVSDDECYDDGFPDHPLSKVRRLLAAIPISSRVGSLSARAASQRED